MTIEPPMRLHHVVFCVRPENQERAAGLWRELGLQFQEVSLEDLSVRVLIDWNAGIEIISPTDRANAKAADFTAFLNEKGEGLYSVVMGVSEVDGPAAIAARYGAPIQFEQRRAYGSFQLDEIMLAPVHGMAITFLATRQTK
jgi:methylmalonyl-CoA/ethylmalonyl-CoA epimerase